MENFKILTLITLGTISRLIPHPANFTGIGGLAITAGAKKESALIPLLSMAVADLFLGFDSLVMRIIVYGSVGLMYLTGRLIKNNLWAASVVGSTLFFVVTNLGVWVTSTMYAKTLFGLMQCFYMALPFWRNALMADVIFTQVFAILLVHGGRIANNLGTIDNRGWNFWIDVRKED